MASRVTRDRVLCTDDYGNRVWLRANVETEHPDLSTDGRVVLTPAFARRLTNALAAFARGRARRRHG